MLVVFDLDFTLWDCGGTWCDHTDPPYSRHARDGSIRDAHGRNIRLYRDVLEILNGLQTQPTSHVLAVASRTSAPDWAKELMELFNIEKYFQHFEIYPGSKIRHFKSLQEKTGIPYSEMVFFDDEYRNIQEVGDLGVKAVLVEDGINAKIIQKNVPGWS